MLAPPRLSGLYGVRLGVKDAIGGGSATVEPQECEKELLRLQTELVYMQEWIVAQRRSGGWTEQTDLGIRQAIRRGLTTRRRLEVALSAKWRSRLDGVINRTRREVRTSAAFRTALEARLKAAVSETCLFPSNFGMGAAGFEPATSRV